MKTRLYSLIQIGRFLGIDEMLKQVSKEEHKELHKYLRRYFLNTHGMSQKDEMRAWEYQQEGTELGYKYLRALYDYTR